MLSGTQSEVLNLPRLCVTRSAISPSSAESSLLWKDHFDLAPKEYMSKVMLEKKVFKTWYDCCAALIDDVEPIGWNRSHKRDPHAIILANYIHALPDHTITDEVEATFKAYQEERIEWVQSTFETSQTFRNMIDKDTKARITQFAMRNLPGWIFSKFEEHMLSTRPQVYFLPLDETELTMKPAY
ncbi:hypothetical protein BGZ47_006339 [Haplosporangium gracile]|nr:hypothetical protein BGZ47_006339 [Haplosporangium gracile]